MADPGSPQPCKTKGSSRKPPNSHHLCPSVTVRSAAQTPAQTPCVCFAMTCHQCQSWPWCEPTSWDISFSAEGYRAPSPSTSLHMNARCVKAPHLRRPVLGPASCLHIRAEASQGKPFGQQDWSAP